MKTLLFLAAALSVVTVTGCASKQQQPTMQTMALHLPVAPALKSCQSVDGLPDRTCTPGSVRTTDAQSICNGGSTKQYRPPVSYTNDLKQKGIAAYGYADTSMADYEEDHLISLEIGGDGKDPANLWPEPHAGKYNSFVKDQVENWLHDQICKTKTMTPEEAQKGIATDWRQYIPQVLASKSKRTEVQ